MRRNEIIAQRRAELGLSIREVGDAVGYEDVAIQQIEETHEGLDAYCLHFLKDLSAVLQLPATLLIFS
jgi:transcriptional regulator with XRE-family HTH domain